MDDGSDNANTDTKGGRHGRLPGQTPCHPSRRRKPGESAHEAKTVPGRRPTRDRPAAATRQTADQGQARRRQRGRLQTRDRPAAANAAKEPGHYEMETVVSGRGGRGGLLVLRDRCNRRHVVERVSHVNQNEVVRAVGKMKARKARPVVRSVTTGNGGTFPDQSAFGAKAYGTRAYASYEKGAARKTSRRGGVPMGRGAMESPCSQDGVAVLPEPEPVQA